VRRGNPGHVKGIVGGLIRKWETGTVKKGNAVTDAWLASVEEDTKGHARPVSFKKGILMVIVENAPWLYRLTVEKRTILAKFNENYTGRKKATDIRYRIGDIDG